MAEKQNGRKCFIITPIGENGSRTFRKAKGVIESSIRPVLTEAGFCDIKPAYEITESGMIGNQIIDRILNDDLVVVNLTGVNPNVMYELAVRHVIARPIIHICEIGTELPFDIKGNRTIFYDNDMLGVEELKKELKKYVAEIDFSKRYTDNPICNGTDKMENVFASLNNEPGNADILLRLQSNSLQVDNFQKKFLHEIPNLSVVGYKKAGNIFLIYIQNKGKQTFLELSANLRKISEYMGIKVFFIDDLKNE